MSNQSMFFKKPFTLKQYSAFALAFNYAADQYDILEKTVHFTKVHEHNDNHKHNDNQYDFKPLLNLFRNYFSHYKSSWPNSECLSNKKLYKELDFLVREAIFKLEQRGVKLDKNTSIEKQIKEKLDEIQKNPKNFFPLDRDKNIQPALALILSLFLTKSQMSWLAGKFFKGPQITKDSPEYLAKRHILMILAQNDRTVIDSSTDSDSLIPAKKETAYAIWSKLESAGLYDDNKIEMEGFPEDVWFMKQLILYIQHTEALKSVVFARINTQEESGKLEQKTVFDLRDRKSPLKIRNNTIEIKVNLEGRSYKTNFGIHTLKYLVLAHLRDVNINDFVVNWFKNNTKRTGSKQKSFGVSKERLEKHIDNLIQKYEGWAKENNKIKLYSQIRFICLFLNKAWYNKNNRYMYQGEFIELQQKIRHYRKDIFQKELDNKDLTSIQNLELGKNNDKTLISFFMKNRIQEVFKDMLESHIEWLKEQKNKIPASSEEENKKTAVRLSLRNIEKKSPKENLPPAAMGSTIVKEKFETEKKINPQRFSHHIQALCGRSYDIIKQETGQENSKLREKRARTGLLSEMIKKLLNQPHLTIINKKPSEQDVEENITNDIKVKFKLTQGWRHYAVDNKTYLKKLINTYYGNNNPCVLNLHDTTNQSTNTKPQDTESIKSLKNKSEKERFLLMQAILKLEEKVSREFSLETTEGNNYVSFDTILEKLNCSELQKVKSCRNACMHKDIWEKPFSKAPEPSLQKLYREIEQYEKDKRTSQRNTGKQKYLGKKWKKMKKNKITSHDKADLST